MVYDVTGGGNAVTASLYTYFTQYYVRVNPVAANAYGIDTIIATITDDSLASVSDTFIVNVQNVNDPPVAGSLYMATFDVVEDSGTFFIADLDTAFTDIDNNIDDLNFRIIDSTIIATIINDSVQVSVTNNIYGNKFVQIEADDGVDTVSLWFYVNIQPVNDPPILLDIPDFSFDEDIENYYELNFGPYFKDVDNDLNNLTFTFNSITFSYYNKWDSLAYFKGAKDWYGKDTVEMIINDGYLSDTTTFIITVNPINDAPDIFSYSSIYFDEDSLFFLDFYNESNYRDVDNNFSSLTKSLSVKNNTIDVNGYYVAPANWYGSDSLTLIVSDGLLSDTAIIPISVNPVNDPPMFLVNMPDTSWLEDMQFEIPMDSIWKYVYDVDNDTSQLDFIIYGRDNVKVEIIDDVIVISSYDEDWYGTDIIDYAITDPSTGMIPYQNFAVTILPVNDAPDAFSILLPEDGSSLNTMNFNFQWNSSYDPEEQVLFTLYLSGGDFDTSISGISGFGLEFNGNGILKPSVEYSWYVVGTDGIVNVECDEHFTFTISDGTENISLSNQSGYLINSYPNPFSQSTTFEYNLPVTSNVKLVVYDITGQEVAVLIDGEMPAGLHQLTWNGKNNEGNLIQSGIYIYQLSVSNLNGDALYQTERRLMFIK